MFTQLLAVARHALIEAIRQPVFAVILLVVSGGIALCIPMSAYTFDDDNKLMVDLGISCIFLGGVLLAAFTASGVVSREIENKTVATVVSKPLPRPVFIVGKYMGVLGALTLALWTWSLVLMLALRHGVPQTAGHRLDWPVLLFGGMSVVGPLAIAAMAHYHFGRPFAQTLSRWLAIFMTGSVLGTLALDRQWQLQPLGTDLDVQLLIVLLLVGLSVWLMGAVALAASTRLGLVPTLLVCLIVWMLGLSNDALFGKSWEAAEPTTADLVARFFSQVIPNVGYLYNADALTQQHAISGHYVGMVALYTALLILAMIALAISLFQTRQAS